MIIRAFWASLVAQMVKNPPASRRPGFDPWVGEIPWRMAWPPTPVFLDGEFSWTEEPGGLQSLGSQRVGHDWVTKDSTAQGNSINKSMWTNLTTWMIHKNLLKNKYTLPLKILHISIIIKSDLLCKKFSKVSLQAQIFNRCSLSNI